MPSKNRPLIFEETTRPVGFKLSELSDQQMKIISYLLRVAYADVLINQAHDLYDFGFGRLLISDEEPSDGSYEEVVTDFEGPVQDNRRVHFLWDPVNDNDFSNRFIEAGANPNTDIERVSAFPDEGSIGMTTIQDEGEPDAQAGVSWPNTGFGPEGPNRTRSIGDNANTNFDVTRVRALKQYADGVANTVPNWEFEDALTITDVGDVDPLVVVDSPHEFYYWQLVDTPDAPSAEDCDEFGYAYYDESGFSVGAGICAIGRDEAKVITAIIDDCIKEMKTGDGIGTYYVFASQDAPTDTAYEKIGTFFWDTRSDYTDPEANASDLEQGTSVEIEIVEYWEYYLKTKGGDDFNLTDAYYQFDNMVFLDLAEEGSLKTIELDGSHGSEDDIISKYSPIDDLIQLILLPILLRTEQLPMYGLTKSRPARDVRRGDFKDTKYRKNISYLSPDYASTYTYQRVEIPDSDGSLSTTKYYFYVK